MKIKKAISAVMAMAVTASALTAFNAFAVDDPDATGNSILDAVPVSFNEKIESQFSKTSYGSCDNDWYSFSLDTASKLNLTLYSELIKIIGGNGNPTCEIIDADNDNNVVFLFDEFKNSNLCVVYLTAGNYYIHLAQNTHLDAGEYSMLLTNIPTEESFESKSNNNIGDASPVEFGNTYTGQISANDDADYYTFDVAEEGKVTFTFNGDLANVDWKLYNSDAKVLQSGVFTEAEPDDSIYNKKSYVLTEGTFTLGITKNKDESCGNYTLAFDYIKDYNSLTVGEAFACADVNKDHLIDANDASAILSYYAYLSTGGTETDMSVWMETDFLNS